LLFVSSLITADECHSLYSLYSAGAFTLIATGALLWDNDKGKEKVEMSYPTKSNRRE
jgi:hypothetical protein